MTHRFERALLIVLCITAALPRRAAAQADQIASLAPQCPAGATPRLDSTAVTIGLWPSKKWRDASYNDAQRLRMGFYADGIRQHFVAPSSLGDAPILAERNTRPDDGNRMAISGSLALIVTPEGRLRTIAWEQVPLSAPLANAIAAAALKADSNGAFVGIPRRDGALDTLSLTVGSWTDKAPERSAALLRAKIPGYVIERDVEILDAKKPEYPANAKRNFAESVSVATFIVGTDGKAYLPSFQVIRTNFADFEPSIRVALAFSSYRPARSNGCAVPRLVSQRFDFKMSRP